jgi:hypothetical protein
MVSGIWTCSRSTGLKYTDFFIRSSRNMTRRGYKTFRTLGDQIRNMGATTSEQLKKEACGADVPCLDALLMGVLPAVYSSNNSADTGGYAYISPAQVCATCYFACGERSAPYNMLAGCQLMLQRHTMHT